MRQMPNQGPPAPERIQPEPEKVAGPVFPYRGQEQHGVESESHPWPEPKTEARDNQPGYQAMAPIKEQDPIPVTIVTEYGRELRKWRTISHHVSGPAGNVVQLVGRLPGRTRIRIQNTKAFNETAPHPTVRVSHDPSILTNPQWGFQILPGAILELVTEDPVYATVETWFDASWDIPVMITEEYRIEA
jgi:hypothetical protein